MNKCVIGSLFVFSLLVFFLVQMNFRYRPEANFSTLKCEKNTIVAAPIQQCPSCPTCPTCATCPTCPTCEICPKKVETKPEIKNPYTWENTKVFHDRAMVLYGQPIRHEKPVVPKIVHYIYGMNSPPPFLLFHFFTIMSARKFIKPDRIILHCRHEPVGPLWEITKPLVELDIVDEKWDSYNGMKINHHAHKTDFLRLHLLKTMGGMVLDTDIWVLKSFDDLLHYDYVMGQEGVDGFKGLCNSVMISAPNSTFSNLYISKGNEFDQAQWNYYAVIVPKRLACVYPETIKVLPNNAFFTPFWDGEGERQFYKSNDYDARNNYAVHFWNSGGYGDKYFGSLTYDAVLHPKILFHRLANHIWNYNMMSEDSLENKVQKKMEEYLSSLPKKA